MAETVIDNAGLGRYELEVEGAIAYVNYTRGPGTLSLDHTEVPSQLAGKGAGSRLARGALELARREGTKVTARCEFIRGYLRKHPEFQDLAADGET